MELIDRNPAAAHTALSLRDPHWLDRKLYPFASRFHETPEGRMHYVDEGKGKPILFVHGTPSWSFEWRHAIVGLRERARCIAPDHLGFGLSDKPTVAAYRPQDHARRLLAFVRALDLRDLTLVLHDFGGPIGLPVLLEEPERVRSVVIVNTWAWSQADDPRVGKISRIVASPLGRFLYRWLNASPRWLVPQSMVQRARFTPQMHAHYMGPFSRRSERTAPWVLGCELAGSDAYYASLWERREALNKLPVTVVWGQGDPAFGKAHLEKWQQALPHARVLALAGVGHFPQEEAPQQLLAAVEASALS
jgi:pimeloyl-ACP methyl ester carboxylesterase